MTDGSQATTPKAPPHQNTLMGLPAELKVMIMNKCVKVPFGPIRVDSTAPRTRRLFGRTPIQFAKLEALEPILAIGNEELFRIAEQEFYRANTMGVMLKPYTRATCASLPEYTFRRYLVDTQDERPHIQHLRVELTSDFTVRYRHPTIAADCGKPEAALLRELPLVYPRLRSLTLLLYHAVSPYERRLARPGDEESVAVMEFGFVTNIVSALREVKRACRNVPVSLSFSHPTDMLVHGPIIERKPAEIYAGLVDADAELAWQVLDLPESIVHF
ncbi:hypothetical protein LTR36_004431 [Oleoguttula mirabilis]|uniref:Uncharacterized protein n=1 Tax=Oleoguttula mirabilis TaxID=1507867 RepID=A0AAV9JGY0_9PEZI|nr:hypothetical protein LTR36_004431 [Oleoguttula mirabilis]